MRKGEVRVCHPPGRCPAALGTEGRGLAVHGTSTARGDELKSDPIIFEGHFRNRNPSNRKPVEANDGQSGAV